MNKILVELTAGINTKSTLSLIGSVVAYLVGDNELAFGVLFVLTFIDGMTGIYKAWYNEVLSSVRFRDKIAHYIAYCLVIVSMNQVLLIMPNMSFMAEFVILYFASGELISIMENLEEAGIPMPTYIKSKLLEVSKRKEQRYKKYNKK